MPQRRQSCNPEGQPVRPADRHDWIDRLTGKVTHQPNGCWTVGDPDTYAKTHTTRRGYEGVHRLVYMTLVDTIPDDWHVHHKCETKGCINPAHLEALSPADHARTHARRRRTP
jgi:hypothetical protein